MWLERKPGPGSLSEAVQMHLPVIVVRNRWTLPQERYNAQWVQENGVGVVLPSFAKVDRAVAELVRDLPRYRAATARMHNQAVFELPGILRNILEQADAFDARSTVVCRPRFSGSESASI